MQQNAFIELVTRRLRALHEENQAADGAFDEEFRDISDEASIIVNTAELTPDRIAVYADRRWLQEKETLANLRKGHVEATCVPCRACGKGYINKKRGENTCNMCGKGEEHDMSKPPETSGTKTTSERWGSEAETHLKALFALQTLPLVVNSKIDIIKKLAIEQGLSAANIGSIEDWRKILSYDETKEKKDREAKPNGLVVGLQQHYIHIPKIIGQIFGVWPPTLDEIDKGEILNIHAHMRNAFSKIPESERRQKNLPNQAMFEYIILNRPDFRKKYKGVFIYFKSKNSKTKMELNSLLTKMWDMAMQSLSK